MLRLRTEHSKDFDILTSYIDPRRSIYADMQGYVEKITALYESLGVQSALWAVPDDLPIKYVSIGKEVAYIFEIEECRVLTYIDTDTWDTYIFGKSDDFRQSCDSSRFRCYSALVRVPLVVADLIERRTHRILGSPDRFEAIEVLAYRDQ